MTRPSGFSRASLLCRARCACQRALVGRSGASGHLSTEQSGATLSEPPCLRSASLSIRRSAACSVDASRLRVPCRADRLSPKRNETAPMLTRASSVSVDGALGHRSSTASHCCRLRVSSSAVALLPFDAACRLEHSSWRRLLRGLPRRSLHCPLTVALQPHTRRVTDRGDERGSGGWPSQRHTSLIQEGKARFAETNSSAGARQYTSSQLAAPPQIGPSTSSDEISESRQRKARANCLKGGTFAEDE